MADDEWDTGADDGEFQQDRFNTFDPMKAIGGPPSVTEVVKSAEKPSVVGHSFEIDNVAASLSKVDVSAAAATFSAPAPTPAAPPAVPTRSAGLPPRAPAPVSVSVSAAEPQSEPAPGPSPSNAAGNLFKTSLASPTGSSGAGGAFTTKLSAEGLAYFQEISRKPFSAQAVAFLNAYWTEIGDQAEFIFSVTWETMKMADMRTKGVSLIHLYDEGSDVDFVTAIYFYESLFKLVMEQPAGKPWREDKRYKPSMPEMMTSIVRKQELRDKVDADFDGRISLLEVLLHQYQEHCSPADFVQRSMATGVDEDAAVKKARLALEEVNKAIRAYEQEKQRLTAESKEPGVKGLAAVNLLAQLNASPLAETLNASLIKAEAAVRMASRKLGQTGSIFTMAADQRTSKPTDGAMWWMSRDLAEKKKRYGRA